MNDERHLLPKAEALAVLRRTGVPEETIQALDAPLDDPVDVDHGRRQHFSPPIRPYGLALSSKRVRFLEPLRSLERGALAVRV